MITLGTAINKTSDYISQHLQQGKKPCQRKHRKRTCSIHITDGNADMREREREKERERTHFLKELHSFHQHTHKKLTRSSASSRSCCLAFSTSSFGPRIATRSLACLAVGNLMWTPPHSSWMLARRRPLRPMMLLWYFWGMLTSTWTMLPWKVQKKKKQLRHELS